jgi:hypothetical protein
MFPFLPSQAALATAAAPLDGQRIVDSIARCFFAMNLPLCHADHPDMLLF